MDHIQSYTRFVAQFYPALQQDIVIPVPPEVREAQSSIALLMYRVDARREEDLELFANIPMDSLLPTMAVGVALLADRVLSILAPQTDSQLQEPVWTAGYDKRRVVKVLCIVALPVFFWFTRVIGYAKSQTSIRDKVIPGMKAGALEKWMNRCKTDSQALEAEYERLKEMTIENVCADVFRTLEVNSEVYEVRQATQLSTADTTQLRRRLALMNLLKARYETANYSSSLDLCDFLEHRSQNDANTSVIVGRGGREGLQKLKRAVMCELVAQGILKKKQLTDDEIHALHPILNPTQLRLSSPIDLGDLPWYVRMRHVQGLRNG